MSLFGAPSYSPVGGEYCHTDNTDDTDKAAGLRVKSLYFAHRGRRSRSSRFKVQSSKRRKLLEKRLPTDYKDSHGFLYKKSHKFPLIPTNYIRFA